MKRNKYGPYRSCAGLLAISNLLILILVWSVKQKKTNTKIKIDDLLEYTDILFRYFEVPVIEFHTVF